MSKSSSPLVYKDIWYGDFVNETNDQFNKHHLVSLATFRTVLSSIGFRILTVTKPQRSDIYFLKVSNSAGNRFNILFETLKHSGSPDNRLRAHINPSAVKNSGNEKIYLFGGYNTGDELLFVVGEITEFVNKTKIMKNNSSFWIGTIEELMKIYKRDEYVWYRIKDNIVLQGIVAKKLRTLKPEDIVNRFFTSGGIQETTPEEKDTSLKEDYNVEPKEINVYELKKMSKKDLLPRNLKYRDIALQNANYTCELCGKKDTFENHYGKEYFEGHHLIMYNVTSQLRFDKSLDIPRNIICLCPECHKKVHFANDQIIKESVVKLFLKHRDLFRIYEIDSLDDILDDYMKYREEEQSE